MKCPIPGCEYDLDLCTIPGFTERDKLMRHLSIIAQTATTMEPHEIMLCQLRARTHKFPHTDVEDGK